MLDSINEEKIIASGAFPHLRNDALKQKLELTQRQERQANKALIMMFLLHVVLLFFVLFRDILVHSEHMSKMYPVSKGVVIMTVSLMFILFFISMRFTFLLSNLKHEARRRGIIEFEV